jgi:hypothetical protein
MKFFMFSKAGSVVCIEKRCKFSCSKDVINVAQEEQGAKNTALKNTAFNFGFTKELTININLLVTASKITAKPVKGSTVNTEFNEFRK